MALRRGSPCMDALAPWRTPELEVVIAGKRSKPLTPRR